MDNSSVKRGRGRPKKEAGKAKNLQVRIRMSQDDLEALDSLSEWAKMNRSETIRALLKEAKNYYIPGQ